MGWDINYSHTKKSDAVADLTRQYSSNGWKLHAAASTSQGFYAAVTSPTGASFIMCALIERRRKEIAVKTMSEHMGPVCVDCPLKLLEAVPDPKESYSTEWRANVRAYHARKKIDLMGKRIALGTGRTYTVDGRQGNSYLVTRDDGQRFRLTRSQAETCKILN